MNWMDLAFYLLAGLIVVGFGFIVFFYIAAVLETKNPPDPG